MESIIKNKISSDASLSKYEQKNLIFLKPKSGDLEKKINDIKALEIDTQKSKYFLLTIIRRLEELEQKLDLCMDQKMKAKNKKEEKK